MTARRFIVILCHADELELPFYADEPEKADAWAAAHVEATGHTVEVRDVWKDVRR